MSKYAKFYIILFSVAFLLASCHAGKKNKCNTCPKWSKHSHTRVDHV